MALPKYTAHPLDPLKCSVSNCSVVNETYRYLNVVVQYELYTFLKKTTKCYAHRMNDSTTFGFKHPLHTPPPPQWLIKMKTHVNCI